MHTLIEDHGSMKKLFFSRNYYLLVDISLEELNQLGKIKHRVILKDEIMLNRGSALLF